MQYKKETTRQKILDCALDEFYEHGKSASISRIAKNAHIAVGNIYNYFPSKQALYESITEPLENKMDDFFKYMNSESLCKTFSQVAYDYMFPYVVENRKLILLIVK